ncbi:MAG: hypothetical protein HUU20_02755 [Pirellulales bacterium]|nr:hypothetical protein [Pirellulales bacterium]
MTTGRRKKPSSKKSERRLRFESLETRQMLSASVGLEDGVLKIEGTEADDQARVYEVGEEIVVEIDGQTAYREQAGKIEQIVFIGRDGNDTFFNNTVIASRALGGKGNDWLLGGLGDDELYGGQGDDVVVGGQGDDLLCGGGGDDQIWGDDGADCLIGGAGDDWLYGLLGSDALYGGQGDDNLYGGEGRDRLYGHDGNDGLFGGDGGATDLLVGGSGADRFLTQKDLWETRDIIADWQAADAELMFVDGVDPLTLDRVSWTDGEIEVLDRGLRQLHEQTGNTRLLKDTLCSRPLLIIKQAADVEPEDGVTLGKNVEFWWYDSRADAYYAWHQILIFDWDESIAWMNYLYESVIVHELAHNWDSYFEMFWKGTTESAAALEAFWYLHESSDPTSSEDYPSEYAMTGFREDWAETWAAYFGYRKSPSACDSILAQKLAAIDRFFASLSEAGSESSAA